MRLEARAKGERIGEQETGTMQYMYCGTGRPTTLLSLDDEDKDVIKCISIDIR